MLSIWTESFFFWLPSFFPLFLIFSSLFMMYLSVTLFCLEFFNIWMHFFFLPKFGKFWVIISQIFFCINFLFPSGWDSDMQILDLLILLFHKCILMFYFSSFLSFHFYSSLFMRLDTLYSPALKLIIAFLHHLHSIR